MDKTAGLTPSDVFTCWPKMDKTAGLTPCDFFNFWPRMDKIAGLTPGDFLHFLAQYGQNCWTHPLVIPSIFDTKLLDLPLVIS